uniref:Uncharacterized protein n=1 Tax=Arundo donax TaxID=35708 RepID=A0A0A8ZQL3_ARUDO
MAFNQIHTYIHRHQIANRLGVSNQTLMLLTSATNVLV